MEQKNGNIKVLQNCEVERGYNMYLTMKHHKERRCNETPNAITFYGLGDCQCISGIRGE